MRYSTEKLMKQYESNPESCFIICFWKPTQNFGVFSQWAPTPFVENGIRYANAEQYMMYQKAMLFGDAATASLILKTTDPAEMKGLGRKISNFDQSTWDSNKVDIVKRGNTLKFSQNLGPAGILKGTGHSVLAEASPYDKIWGVGAGADVAPNLRNWAPDAENLLGFILMEVRDEMGDIQSMINAFVKAASKVNGHDTEKAGKC